MRVPTITTILSLVALFTFSPARAIANNETEYFTTQRETNRLRDSNSGTLNFAQEQANNSKNQALRKQESNNFLIPFFSRNSRTYSKPAQPELFSEPFYSGVPRKQDEEKNLSQGSRGAEVWAVQRRLQARGFDPGSVDSVFGSRTTKAVKAFQESKGLDVTGIVDDTTWKALGQPSFTPRRRIQPQQAQVQVQQPQIQAPILLTKGDRGSKVKTLQVSLETMGFDPGPIDGIFGVKTTGAVKEFQKSQGIKADGIVNKKTWAAFSQK